MNPRRIGGIASVGAVVAVALTFFFLLIAIAKRYKKVGPNEVMIISGRKHKMATGHGTSETTGFRIRTGGGAFAAYLALDWLFKQTQGGSEYNVSEATGKRYSNLGVPPPLLCRTPYGQRRRAELASLCTASQAVRTRVVVATGNDRKEAPWRTYSR